MSALTWTGDDERREANTEQCNFTLTKLGRDYCLNGTGHEGGQSFKIEVVGPEASLLKHAQTLADAFAMVTTTKPNCGDCGAEPGALHVDGCDVEQCCLCGGQRLSCDCVWHVNGISAEMIEAEPDPLRYEEASSEMVRHLELEEERFGGRLPWTGVWPGNEAAARMNLWCYWGNRETGEPQAFPKLLGADPPGARWPCEKSHPGATPDTGRLCEVAKWDKEKRDWVDTRVHS